MNNPAVPLLSPEVSYVYHVAKHFAVQVGLKLKCVLVADDFSSQSTRETAPGASRTPPPAIIGFVGIRI